MSDFIEDFYYGNLEPQECTTHLTAKKNALISTGKYTDGVDEVLLKIMRSKLKKVRVKYL